jgi:hypothetical protein
VESEASLDEPAERTTLWSRGKEYRKTKSPHQVAKAVIRVHLLLLLFVLEKSISGENKAWFGEAPPLLEPMRRNSDLQKWVLRPHSKQYSGLTM